MAIKEKIKEIKTKVDTKAKEVKDKAKDFYEEHKGGIMFAAGYAVAGGIAIFAEKALYGRERVVELEYDDDAKYSYEIFNDGTANQLATRCRGGVTANTNLGRKLSIPSVVLKASIDDVTKENMIDLLSNLPE